MERGYDSYTYWQNRLSATFDWRGAGNKTFNKFYNDWLYFRKKHVLNGCFNKDLYGKNVLDIGCGTGFWVQWYIEKKANVIGLDITDVSIESLSMKFKNNRFFVTDITSHEYKPPMKFDIINMYDVIFHIVDDSAFNQALINIAKSCAPGALFIVNDRFGASNDTETDRYVKLRCLNTYQSILPKLGFKLFRLVPLYTFLNIYHKGLGGWNNHLAPLFFIVDLLISRIPKDNLSLAIWRYG